MRDFFLDRGMISAHTCLPHRPANTYHYGHLIIKNVSVDPGNEDGLFYGRSCFARMLNFTSAHMYPACTNKCHTCVDTSRATCGWARGVDSVKTTPQHNTNVCRVSVTTHSPTWHTRIDLASQNTCL
ncbi:hypothetical protein Zmor_002931 [Zophobas morio]|uniref:Uncharacterized protein n=1 Tax=Zophobas morio TaxID=2755281 RepID=A0AA38HKT3_9CUCU|nr:hypothetical protein Zmor_002931 [Zophobas morio]